MSEYNRRLNLAAALAQKSHFLFGPRQVGKTSLIRKTLPNARIYNLLETDALLSLSQRPARLREEVIKPGSLVVIDEVQLLPELLNEVHWLIEERKTRFLLTGSSARKLRRGGVNLLGGRARTLYMHPLTSAELGSAFKLERALSFGTLPAIYNSLEPDQDLRDYVASYLRIEVAAEASVRHLPAFSRFLEVAALCNAQQLNFSAIGNDAQVARTTVHEYFEILQDTLVANLLEPYGVAKKRKPVVTPKLYFFDIGVARSILDRGALRPQDADVGVALEGYLFHELSAYRDEKPSRTLHYWRAENIEVDFVLNGHTGIEVKHGRNIGNQDLKSLRIFADETRARRLICACNESRPRRVDNIDIWPIKHFLDALWGGELD